MFKKRGGKQKKVDLEEEAAQIEALPERNADPLQS